MEALKRRFFTKAFLPCAAALLCMTACFHANAYAQKNQETREMLPGAFDQPLEQIEGELPDAHPVNYFIVAEREFRAGDKSKGVFWYYVGQIRYRFYLLANPHLDPGGDPALFTAMQDVTGQSINRYAGGHLDETINEINDALKWDADNKNGFTSETDHAKEWKEARDQVVKLRNYLSTHKKEIHKQREANGIADNETGGVGIREPMPTDWPPLRSKTTLEDVAGRYKLDVKSLLDAIFFSGDQRDLIRATAIEFRPITPDALLLIAWDGSKKLTQKQIAVHEEDGSVIYEEKDPGDKEHHLPPSLMVVHIRTNEKHQLVLERDIYDEPPSKPKPEEPTYTFWNRAMRVCDKNYDKGCQNTKP